MVTDMDPHEPVTSPYVPPVPKTDIWCWNCERPQLFVEVHTGVRAGEVDPTACRRCKEGTRLACKACGKPYMVRALSGQVEEPGSKRWRV